MVQFVVGLLACDAFPFLLSCEALEQPVCGLLEGPLRDQWELHHTVKVTDTPATYSFGHVVGLAALDMVQPWAELDVAGVGLSFANWMAVVIAPYIVFVLMLDLLHFVFRSRVACLWIGPRLALAARCG